MPDQSAPSPAALDALAKNRPSSLQAANTTVDVILAADASPPAAALRKARGEGFSTLAHANEALGTYLVAHGHDVTWRRKCGATPPATQAKADPARWAWVQACRAARAMPDPRAGAAAVIAAAVKAPAVLTGPEAAAVEKLRVTLSAPPSKSAARASSVATAPAPAASNAAADLLSKYLAMPAGPERAAFAAKHYNALMRAQRAAPVAVSSPRAQAHRASSEAAILAQYKAMPAGTARTEFAAKHFNVLVRARKAAARA